MDLVSEMPHSIELVRDQLTHEFPKEKIAGLNLSRVEEFVKKQGMEINNYIILEQSDIPRIRKIVGDSDWGSSLQEGSQACYVPKLDLAFYLRNQEREKKNGTVFEEGIIVHELTHASSKRFGYIASDNWGFVAIRSGFCLMSGRVEWGWFLEEGWADMNRANYVLENATLQEKTKVLTLIDKKEGNYDDMFTVEISGGQRFSLPIKYVGLDFLGEASLVHSVLAGYGVELLCNSNPKLKNTYLEARRSVDGLRKFAREIEDITPGLYTKLQKGDSSAESFAEKLSYILELTNRI